MQCHFEIEDLFEQLLVWVTPYVFNRNSIFYTIRQICACPMKLVLCPYRHSLISCGIFWKHHKMHCIHLSDPKTVAETIRYTATLYVETISLNGEKDKMNRTLLPGYGMGEYLRQSKIITLVKTILNIECIPNFRLFVYNNQRIGQEFILLWRICCLLMLI